MLYAVCCMLHAVCCMLRAVCCALHAACCTLYLARCMLHVPCSMLRAACCTLCAARCNVACEPHQLAGHAFELERQLPPQLGNRRRRRRLRDAALLQSNPVQSSPAQPSPAQPPPLLRACPLRVPFRSKAHGMPRAIGSTACSAAEAASADSGEGSYSRTGRPSCRVGLSGTGPRASRLSGIGPQGRIGGHQRTSFGAMLSLLGFAETGFAETEFAETCAEMRCCWRSAMMRRSLRGDMRCVRRAVRSPS